MQGPGTCGEAGLDQETSRLPGPRLRASARCKLARREWDRDDHAVDDGDDDGDGHMAKTVICR